MLELLKINSLETLHAVPEMFLGTSVLQLTCFAVLTSNHPQYRSVVVYPQAYTVGILVLIMSSSLLCNEDLVSCHFLSTNSFIINDYLGFIAKFWVCITSLVSLILTSMDYGNKTIKNHFEYTILILMSVFGLLLLCSSNDLMTAYLAIELQSIAFYIMAAFKKNSAYSIESGLKYFIVGSLSSSFFLFGSSIIYGCVGSLNFDDIRIFLSLAFQENTPYHRHREFVLNMIPMVISYIEPDFVDSITSCMVMLTPSFILTSMVMLPRYESEMILFHPTQCGFDHSNINAYAVRLLHLNNDPNPGAGFHIIKHIVHEFVSSAHHGPVEGGFGSSPSYLNLDVIHLGFLFLCLSLFIKLSLAPFHFWSLDVYEGAPNTTTMFFSVVPKIGLFILLTRICYSSFDSNFASAWQSYFLFISVFTLTESAKIALVQRFRI